MNSLQTGESDKEIRFHVNYLLLLWKKSVKKADSSEDTNIDGENLTNLEFADDAALFNEKKKQLSQWKTLNEPETRKSESWPKITQGKDKIHDKSCRQ